MIDFLQKLSRIGATNGMSERQVEGIVSQKICPHCCTGLYTGQCRRSFSPCILSGGEASKRELFQLRFLPSVRYGTAGYPEKSCATASRGERRGMDRRRCRPWLRSRPVLRPDPGRMEGRRSQRRCCPDLRFGSLAPSLRTAGGRGVEFEFRIYLLVRSSLADGDRHRPANERSGHRGAHVRVLWHRALVARGNLWHCRGVACDHRGGRGAPRYRVTNSSGGVWNVRRYDGYDVYRPHGDRLVCPRRSRAS